MDDRCWLVKRFFSLFWLGDLDVLHEYQLEDSTMVFTSLYNLAELDQLPRPQTRGEE